jgi:formate dehydrogenase major subunit
MNQLAVRLIAKAKESTDPLDQPLRALDWWYPEDKQGAAETEAVLAEINGWHNDPQPNADGVMFGLNCEGQPHHGPQLNGYPELKDDGSTSCGCWIYSGVLGPDKINKANARQSKDYLGHGWGFSWPGDRRIIYNRASASPTGEPWSERKKLVWWDQAQSKWTGVDVPDFPVGKPPDYRPTRQEKGLDAIPGNAPFILHEDGLGWIYVPKGLQDGPFPTHYEPLESPVRNLLYSRDTDPVVNWFTRQENRFAPPGDPRFPYVLTTYRLTEHHTAGGMSRFLSHLAELQPEMFAEISPELAKELKIDNGDYICIVTLRGAIESRALVSRRTRPLQINGKTVHQVAVPFHFGSAGPVRGDAANDLLAISGEPNVTIMETKALACSIVPGRLPRGPAFEAWLDKYVPRGGPPNLHPEQPPPSAPAGDKLKADHGQHGSAEEAK